jgi:hypothetical protein
METHKGRRALPGAAVHKASKKPSVFPMQREVLRAPEILPDFRAAP